MNKTKIALAVLLLAGTASASLATEFDPNPANRYPAYTGSATRTLQSAPVRSAGQRAGSRRSGSAKCVSRLPHSGGVG